MKLNKGKVLAAALGALVLILIITSLTRKKRGEVKSIVAEIQHISDGQNDFIKEKDVLEIIDRSFEEKIAEMRVGKVDVNRVERVLEQDPFIENAEAFFDADNALHVKITQREPICRIIDNNNANYYLDKNGVKMPLSKYFSARVPIVTGAVPPHIPDFLQKKNYGLKNVFDLLQRLRGDAFYNTFVQQIYVDPSGEFTLIPVLGDQKIKIGTLENLDEKLSRLIIFYKEAMPYEGWRKFSTISVKYNGQIVCKKR